ncbi:MAG: hypothetical protein ABIW82_08935 [Dokdonella sp.]
MRTLHVTCLALALSASVATAADGDFDPTYGLFNSGKNTVGLDLGGSNNDLLSDMLVAPDGSAYLVGTSNRDTGYTAASVVKMTPQGLQDSTFDSHDGYSVLGPINSDTYAEHASFDTQGNVIVAATQLAGAQDTSLAI